MKDIRNNIPQKWFAVHTLADEQNARNNRAAALREFVQFLQKGSDTRLVEVQHFNRNPDNENVDSAA
jgi:hypothetical protein